MTSPEAAVQLCHISEPAVRSAGASRPPTNTRGLASATQTDGRTDGRRHGNAELDFPTTITSPRFALWLRHCATRLTHTYTQYTHAHLHLCAGQSRKLGATRHSAPHRTAKSPPSPARANMQRKRVYITIPCISARNWHPVVTLSTDGGGGRARAPELSCVHATLWSTRSRNEINCRWSAVKCNCATSTLCAALRWGQFLQFHFSRR